MSSSRWRYFWAGLAAIHIILLGLGALELRAQKRTKLMDAFLAYGALTGATDGYRFFAPEILTEVRARFVLEDFKGKTSDDTLQRGVSREASLRIGNMIGVISEYVEDENPEMRRRIAASWAGKMFARHPEAKKVTVVLEGYELSSLPDWEKEKRASWNPFYQVSFVRKPSAVPVIRGAE